MADGGLEEKPRSRKRNAVSKYDLVKVKVWLGENMDHHYVLSRFLISRMLTVTRIPYLKAVKIALDLKKYLVDNNYLDIKQEQLEDLLFRMIRERGFDEKYIRCYQMVTSFMRQRQPLIILISGSPCTGKSTIAQQLASRLNLPNVMQADITYELLRSSGLAGKPLFEQGDIPPEAFLDEYRRQCLVVRKGLDGDFKKTMNDGKPLILEGLHLDPALYLEEFGRVGIVMMPGGLEDEEDFESGPPSPDSASRVLTQRLSARFDPALLHIPSVLPPLRRNILRVGRCKSFDERALQRLREEAERAVRPPGALDGPARPSGEAALQQGARLGVRNTRQGSRLRNAGPMRNLVMQEGMSGGSVQDDDAVSDRSTTQSHANSPTRLARTSSTTSSPFPHDLPTPEPPASASPPATKHPANHLPFLTSLETQLAKLTGTISAPPSVLINCLPGQQSFDSATPPADYSSPSMHPSHGVHSSPTPDPLVAASPFFLGHFPSAPAQDHHLPPIYEIPTPLVTPNITPTNTQPDPSDIPSPTREAPRAPTPTQFSDPPLLPQTSSRRISFSTPEAAIFPLNGEDPDQDPDQTACPGRFSPQHSKRYTHHPAPPSPLSSSPPPPSPFVDHPLHPQEPTAPATPPLNLSPQPSPAPTSHPSPHPAALPPPLPSPASEPPPAIIPSPSPSSPHSLPPNTLASPFAQPPATITSALTPKPPSQPGPSTPSNPLAGPAPPLPATASSTTPRPLFVPIILRMAPEHHRLVAEEKFLDFCHSGGTCTCDEHDDAQAAFEQRLDRMGLMQDYMCAYEALGLPVVDVQYGNFTAALDELHEYVLKCIEAVMDPGQLAQA